MGPKKSNPPSSKHNRNSKNTNSYLRHSGLAFEVVVYNLLVIFGGFKLDEYLQNKIPWFIILSVILSVGGTIYYLLLRLK